jgi:hypothetical protein
MGPENQSFELPPPIAPQEKQFELSAERAGTPAPEGQASVRPPAFGSMVSMQPALTPSGGPAVVPASPVSGSMLSSMQQVTPAAADDNDIIEREWVSKAKAIIARTVNDPRAQAIELSKFKADYIQKRYNRSVKVVE